MDGFAKNVALIDEGKNDLRQKIHTERMEVQMKNLIIKISSLFVLAIILSVGSVQAQSSRSYKAHIPFDFKIGKKAFQAGDYKISIKEPFEQGSILTVRNAKTYDLGQTTVLRNGSRSQMNKTVLMFDRYDNQYVLTQMISTDFGFFAPKSKAKKLIAKKLGKPDESVAVVLIKGDKNIE